MMPMEGVPPFEVAEIVTRALREDGPWGDATATAVLFADQEFDARFTAREDGVCSGIAVAEEVFAQLDSRVVFEPALADGDRFAAGDVLARVSGPARAIVTGERIALNLLQRMCGVATMTAAYVDVVEKAVVAAGIRAPWVIDTRKTTPGLRILEKYSVRMGGGHNHRYCLSDAVMVKDNHLQMLVEAAGGGDEAVTQALRDVRSRMGHTQHLEVEVDRIDQIEPVVAAGVDSIMLDNFTPEELVKGVSAVAGRCRVEASGGINLDTIGAVATTGVDVISVGALTHAARALDIGLDGA